MKPAVATYTDVGPAEYSAGKFRPDGQGTPVVEAGPAAPTTERIDVGTPPLPGKRRNVPFLILKVSAALTVSFGLGFAGTRWYGFASTHQETDNAYVQAHIHQISSRIPGTVEEVLVDDNQLVTKGQLLVRLDTTDYDIKVKQAKAALESARREALVEATSVPQAAQEALAESLSAEGAIAEARAGISAAQANVRVALTAIPVSLARVAETDATLKKAEADFERYTNLEGQGAVSKQQLDDARAAFLVAEANKQAADEGVKSAQSRLAEAQESVRTAEARLVQQRGARERAFAATLATNVKRTKHEASLAAIREAESKLQDALVQDSYTGIVAPRSGRIGRKSVEIGQHLEPGQPIMAIVDPDVWVVANFKETQLERMRDGQVVDVKIDAYPTKTFKGVIDSIAPASGAQFALLPPDNATGNFTKIVQRVPVKVRFVPESLRGYESKVSPGMSAIVTVAVN